MVRVNPSALASVQEQVDHYTFTPQVAPHLCPQLVPTAGEGGRCAARSLRDGFAALRGSLVRC